MQLWNQTGYFFTNSANSKDLILHELISVDLIDRESVNLPFVVERELLLAKGRNAFYSRMRNAFSNQL